MALACLSGIFFRNPRGFTIQQPEKQEPKKQASMDDVLPLKVLSYIFGFLSPEDLARASYVNRKWRMVASSEVLWNAFDLQKLFPSLAIMDEKVWKEHADMAALELFVDDASPVDKRTLIPILKNVFGSLEVEGESGATYLTIPRGLTLNKLWAFASLPKKGNATKPRYVWDRISQKLGDIPTTETSRVIISNSIFKGTRNLPVTAKEELVNSKGYEMPKAVQVSALAILTYVSSSQSSPTRLYGKPSIHSYNRASVYSCCKEEIDGYTVAVGDFNETGLIASMNHVFDSSSYGSGALLQC